MYVVANDITIDLHFYRILKNRVGALLPLLRLSLTPAYKLFDKYFTNQMAEDELNTSMRRRSVRDFLPLEHVENSCT